MSDLLCSRPHQVAKFVDQTVLPALADGSERSTALKPLLKQMAALSLFGLNIPRQFGGLEETPEQIARTMEELSRGWMCLPSVLGSHMRAAPYILDQGTQEQKEQWLPALASGAQIWAHGYSERRLSATGRLSTEIFESQGHYILNGQKDWVTNAADADRILVVARHKGKTLATVIDPERKEVSLKNLERPGMRGSSLCRVQFRNYRLDQRWEVVGGFEADVSSILAQSRIPKALAFAARAVGATRSAVTTCRKVMQARSSECALHPVARNRWGRLLLHWETSRVLYEAALRGQSCPIMAKVYCGEALRKILEEAMALLGGDGYAYPVDTLERLYRDALALTVAGGPNDLLLSQIADREEVFA